MTTTASDRRFFSAARRFDAVLCDIDGCLCDEHGGALDLPRLTHIAEHNRHAIHHRDRPMVTLCTGRPIAFAECMSRLIANSALPVVCENGVWLYDPTTNDWIIDPRITADHLAAVDALRDYIATEFDALGLRCQPGKTASVSPHHPDTAVLHAQAPIIRQRCQAERWPFRVSASWNYLNCDLTFISKATGIARFEQATGIPRDRRAGIGDTPGDRAIAQAVHTFACPSNRDPALDDCAAFIATTPLAEGVLQILDHLK